MVDHVDAFALVVDDVRECARFYREKLGFVQRELSDDFAYFSFSDAPGPGLALVSREGYLEELKENGNPDKKSLSAKSYFASFLKNADDEHEQLKNNGVSFVTLPAERPNGQRYSFFADPEGNLWEISHFPEGGNE